MPRYGTYKDARQNSRNESHKYEMKDGVDSRFDTAIKNVSELEVIAIETLPNEAYVKERLKRKMSSMLAV
jgi:hypothetical protein